MEKEIKYKIYLQHEDTGTIVAKVFDYAAIFSGNAANELAELKRHFVIGKAEFTGLEDKNGKEIYWNDIVKSETDKPMVVTWKKRFASFCLNRDGWAFSHWFGEAVEAENVEVIGNMFENAELVNKAT